MSFKHFVVFALLAFVAVQGATDLPMEKVDERALSDLSNKAGEAIQKLTTMIHGAIKNAIEKLGQVRATIIETAKYITDSAKSAILGEIEKVREQIEKIIAQSIILGINISGCVIEKNKALVQIPKNAIDNLLQCVPGEINNATASIEAANVEIKQITGTVVSLPGRLGSCIVNENPIGCITNLLGDIVGAIISLPAQITRKVNGVIQLITNIESFLRTCTIRQVVETSKETFQIGAKFAKCVTAIIKA